MALNYWGTRIGTPLMFVIFSKFDAHLVSYAGPWMQAVAISLLSEGKAIILMKFSLTVGCNY